MEIKGRVWVFGLIEENTSGIRILFVEKERFCNPRHLILANVSEVTKIISDVGKPTVTF